MAVAAARTSIKAIKPHIPMIRFPNRGTAPTSKEKKPESLGSVLNSLVNNKGADKASEGPTGSSVDSSQVLNKYRRKPLTKEEMEIIEKGGPV